MIARTAVVAGTATAVSGRVAHNQQQKYAAQEQQAAAQQAAPAEAPAAPDYMAEIEQLSQLKAQGVITEAEFDAKKKQILGI
jgi:membrane protease subunit (stomatin/prohibitin family)